MPFSIKKKYWFEKCPVPKGHGNWSPWSNWGTCSRTCNGGHMRRYRTCDNPHPLNGGRACAGADTQTQRCHAELCPGELGWDTQSDRKYNILDVCKTIRLFLTITIEATRTKNLSHKTLHVHRVKNSSQVLIDLKSGYLWISYWLFLFFCTNLHIAGV